VQEARAPVGEVRVPVGGRSLALLQLPLDLLPRVGRGVGSKLVVYWSDQRVTTPWGNDTILKLEM